MDKCKIIQIIPAPADMLLRYREDDGEKSRWRPLCLALVEYEDGDTEIKLVDIDADGYIDFAEDASNFDGIDWRPTNEHT